MVAEASRRAVDSEPSMEFLVGDAHALDFADATFDAIRVERVLQHLTAPRGALVEMVRVARPGARIVAVEPDYGTLSIVGADEEVTRRIVAARVTHFRSGRIGRDLARLFRDVGIGEARVNLISAINKDCAQDVASGILEKYAVAAEATCCITRTEREVWLNDLQQAGETGRYRHALMVFLVSGVKNRGPVVTRELLKVRRV
jgi:ubiquinone/menaquinone biosynthesis C-methylase UbiE